jgi:hypothetical protein
VDIVIGCRAKEWTGGPHFAHKKGRREALMVFVVVLSSGEKEDWLCFFPAEGVTAGNKTYADVAGR